MQNKPESLGDIIKTARQKAGFTIDVYKRQVKARAKKGSLIWVSGSLELETFTKRDGITTDKRLKILLDNWGFIPVGASKEHPRSAEQTSPETPAPMKAPEIDGGREHLPV